jgi:D-alanyl-D-alanine carboxypeptidase/D-alanyl-D-alanine-endopeptidase (penicillin-binding protein 4)
MWKALWTGVTFCTIATFSAFLPCAGRAEEQSALAIDLETDRIVASEGPRKALVPASVLKLVTAGAAFRSLGPEFTFKSELFLLSKGVKGGTVSIGIRLGLDPEFDDRDLEELLRPLSTLGVSSISSVIIDAPRLKGVLPPSGDRPYDSQVVPTSINYQTVECSVCNLAGLAPVGRCLPSSVPIKFQGDKGGRALEESIVLGNDQIGWGKTLAAVPESHSATGCFSVRTTWGGAASRLFEELFRDVALRLGIADVGKFVHQSIPPSAHMLAVHDSKPLLQIVSDMNRFSTNFIAESLLFAVGSTGDNSYDRSVGIQFMSSMLRKAGCAEDEFSLYDGSGLSRKNRMSSNCLLSFVRPMMIIPPNGGDLLATLPVAGLSGTVKGRQGLASSGYVRAKTGTLDGVSSLVGVRELSGKRLLFAIIQNGIASKESGIRAEDAFVHRLTHPIAVH